MGIINNQIENNNNNGIYKWYCNNWYVERQGRYISCRANIFFSLTNW